MCGASCGAKRVESKCRKHIMKTGETMICLIMCCWFSQFIVIVVVAVVRVFIVDMVVVVAMVALLLPVHAEVVHVTLSLSWSRPGSSWSFYFCCCYCCCSFAVAAVVVVVRLSNKKEGSK